MPEDARERGSERNINLMRVFCPLYTTTGSDTQAYFDLQARECREIGIV